MTFIKYFPCFSIYYNKISKIWQSVWNYAAKYNNSNFWRGIYNAILNLGQHLTQSLCSSLFNSVESSEERLTVPTTDRSVRLLPSTMLSVYTGKKFPVVPKVRKLYQCFKEKLPLFRRATLIDLHLQVAWSMVSGGV